MNEDKTLHLTLILGVWWMLIEFFQWRIKKSRAEDSSGDWNRLLQFCSVVLVVWPPLCINMMFISWFRWERCSTVCLWNLVTSWNFDKAFVFVWRVLAVALLVSTPYVFIKHRKRHFEKPLKTSLRSVETILPRSFNFLQVITAHMNPTSCF